MASANSITSTNEFMPIVKLASTLEDSLNTSRSKINSINDLLKEISNLTGVAIPEKQSLHTALDRNGGHQNNRVTEFQTAHQGLLTQEEREIEDLRKENLTLLLQIQKQKFLNVQITKTINQNKGLVTTLVESLNDQRLEEANKTSSCTELEELEFQNYTNALKSSKESLILDIEQKLQQNEKLKEIIDNFDLLLVQIVGKVASKEGKEHAEKLQRKLNELRREV
ncbi:hypothetical protein WICPIJ_001511 [Wickerhamomyces pijperi]|uniref:Uncharacterized protein n=1 Tax=Wickerhamomyces pijperi TaxID=599730 RepID=A0A9P8QDM6_WICPI|nr:hypothetical protein WICPIJ_001511 [Wickerhamomyces pijperi]